MGYYTNGTLEPKEEVQHIKGSTTTRDAPFLRITGEAHQEGREEETDNSIIPQMLHHP